MAQFDLAGLWNMVAQSADNDRTYLNGLDSSNGNAGDNYAANMQLIANTLDRELRGGQGDAGAALQAAAQTLRQSGRGKTAPIYADGLAGAASKLRGRSGLDANDLMPLLQGLLQGAQGSSNVAPQGQGGMLDALVPGVLSYLGAKQQGLSDTEALMAALGAAQGGMGGLGALGGLLGGAQGGGSGGLSPQGGSGGLGGLLGAQPSAPGYGGGQPEPAFGGGANPGAAGVGSLLQGLLQGMLAQRGQNTPQQPRQEQEWGGSIDM